MRRVRREVRARVVERRIPEVRRLVARGRDQRHTVAMREVHRARRGLDDHALLRLLLRRVGRVARAVEQPRVDVERHVDHVDADAAGVGEGVDRRLEQEEARVLAGADVDDVDLRGDAGHPDAVERRADRAGHVRAVAVVVLVVGVDAARVLARAVVDARLGVVDREVAAQEAVEVRRDVRVLAVDARVHDPDADGVAALIVGVGARRRGADELHVPLQPGERIALDRLRARARCRGSCRARTRRRATTASSTRRARVRWPGCAPRRRAPPRRRPSWRSSDRSTDRRHADVGVLGDDRPAGVADGLMGRRGARVLLVEDDVLVSHGRGCAHGENRAGDRAGAAEDLAHAGPYLLVDVGRMRRGHAPPAPSLIPTLYPTRGG